MRKVILTGLCLLVASYCFGVSNTLNKRWVSIPFSPSKSDTDNYGYYWLDSNSPGGPTYNWIDITGIGTEVIGLGDDNNSGPYNIGFEFPYYWYRVDKFWIESNGAISFTYSDVYFPQEDGGNTIPNTTPPNDLVIPLGADIAFGAGSQGRCYYYSNNVDTLVVSFINVPAWTQQGLVGAHTFQLILSANDSTILFQYGRQQGSFYQNMDCAGIENVIGNDGLQYLLNQMPDSGLAVKFIPPESTTYQAKDIGVYEAISDGSKGIFCFPNEPIQIFATIKNYGNVDAENFNVFCVIRRVAGATQYSDTESVASLPAGELTTVNFRDWTPTATGNYYANVRTALSGDINSINNTKDVEFMVITYPGWLIYDSNPQQAQGSAWYGAGAGWGQEFKPPAYPTIVESVQVTLQTDNAVNTPILFMDDDGPDGSPGTIIYADTINVPAGGGFDYYTIAIPSGLDTIKEGKFYVGMIQTGAQYPAMIMELTTPFSRRAWEFTGVWAPYRAREGSELLIRAFVRGVAGTEEPVANFGLALLPAIPNPAIGQVEIRYQIPNTAKVSLKVYNLLGQEIRTLVDAQNEAGVHSVTFDCKNFMGHKIAAGVYFYRLEVNKVAVTKKFTLL
ncbi:MAG: T9SS type A sorting domain-containing protein [bacterium]|nr:T9SS type A sorting domain-containing protein [bacterium]